MHVAQSVPQMRAVPNVKRKVFGASLCHRVDTGISGRRVSFKLVRLSSSLNRARASGTQPERVLCATTAHEGSWCHGGIFKPCLAPGRAKFQVPRIRIAPGHDKVAFTARRTVLVDVPYWDHGVAHKWAPLANGDQPQNWTGRRYF